MTPTNKPQKPIAAEARTAKAGLASLASTAADEDTSFRETGLSEADAMEASLEEGASLTPVPDDESE